MTEPWSIAMLISGALFAAGTVPIVWERAPAWRLADDATFRAEFAHTLRRSDRLQPALLLACLVSATGFAISATGTARTLAGLAASCFAAVLAGSGLVLVPTQRRLIDPGSDLSAAGLERLKARWLRGHLIRTILALAAFVVLVLAAVG
jgi:anthrone oxygenase-like protein